MQLYTDTISDKSNTYGIECLQGQKVLDTRPLWEEIFSEDSKAFTDYYFAIKAVRNTAFICRHLSTKEIVSMVHLTPYEMTIGGKPVQTYYIVGVATRESHRRKGLMSILLNKAFDYAAGLHCPFVFLMPANPVIYEPFGFSYIYSRPRYAIPELISQKMVYISNFPAGEICIQSLEKETSSHTLNALADFASKTLPAQYDYYLTRTPSYYRTLLLELYAQNGCIYAFTIHGRLEGYFLYAEEERSPFIQELLFSDRLYSFQNSIMSTIFPHALSGPEPVIMAKNLFPASDSLPTGSVASTLHSDKESMQISDYVNYLSTHKGFINEIV